MMTRPSRLLLVAFLAVLAASGRSGAQQPQPAAEASGEEKPSAPRIDLSKLDPAQRFDFLLGDWTYEFTTGRGSTTYRRSSSGTAIVEYLEPGFIQDREFTGVSIFLRDAEGVWRQNWIDTLGNVLEGSGGMKEYFDSDLPAMITEFTQGNNKFRHVWYDIRADRFETDLFLSVNDTAWRMIRRMSYIRKGTEP